MRVLLTVLTGGVLVMACVALGIVGMIGMPARSNRPVVTVGASVQTPEASPTQETAPSRRRWQEMSRNDQMEYCRSTGQKLTCNPVAGR